jgi:hypothetical protein
VPAQNAEAVAMPFEQLAARHATSAPGEAAHVVGSAPSHWLAPHASVGSVGHVRAPWGAPRTGEQVPLRPSTSHAPHGPVHAVSQQTWSTQ